MLNRLLGARAFMSIAGVIVLALVTALTYAVFVNPARPMASYCAIMPDAVGLYPGNHVTMRGIPVGTVTAIDPQGPTVRVEFDVDANYSLPADVAATTLSNTLVADRDLAVLGTGTSAGTWDRQGCITKTLTPKSMTETLNSVAKLFNATLGAGSDDSAIGDGISGLSSATAGTGPEINSIIKKLGTRWIRLTPPSATSDRS